MRLLHARPVRSCAAVLGVIVLAGSTGAAIDDNKAAKPSVSLKASPQVGFSPLRVVLTAELKGGANDFQEFYCPTIEWEWGDFTVSTAEADCDPYSPGKSEIKRRYTVEHRFKNPGAYKIVLRLKKGTKLVASANTQVQVRSGLGQ